jgi:hypothetical protein
MWPDSWFWIGMMLGTLYGTLFVLCSFALFCQITAQLRQSLPKPQAKKPKLKSEQVSLRRAYVRKSEYVPEQRVESWREYTHKVNAPTQPLTTEQLWPDS